MHLHNYGGKFFPLSTTFLNLQAFLGASVLQLLPKGPTFGFHFTKISIFQEFPEGSKTQAVFILGRYKQSCSQNSCRGEARKS